MTQEDKAQKEKQEFRDYLNYQISAMIGESEGHDYVGDDFGIVLSWWYDNFGTIEFLTLDPKEHYKDEPIKFVRVTIVNPTSDLSVLTYTSSLFPSAYLAKISAAQAIVRAGKAMGLCQ